MMRVIANIFLFLSVLFLPWWMTAIFIIAALFIFKNFYEAIAWGFFGDLLYGISIAAFFNFGLFLTLGAGTIFFIVEFLKKRIRYYQ